MTSPANIDLTATKNKASTRHHVADQKDEINFVEDQDSLHNNGTISVFGGTIKVSSAAGQSNGATHSHNNSTSNGIGDAHEDSLLTLWVEDSSSSVTQPSGLAAGTSLPTPRPHHGSLSPASKAAFYQLHEQLPQVNSASTSTLNQSLGLSSDAVVFGSGLRNSVDMMMNEVPPAIGPDLHDEVLQLCRENGLENIAKEAGLIQNGIIPTLKRNPADTDEMDPDQSDEDDGPQPRGLRRARSDSVLLSGSEQKRKKGRPSRAQVGEKNNKGLRHFSLQVSQKVEKKKVTTYNEVADELVAEFSSPDKFASPVDQKNIRRRVYDALNVLMAMNIITKEKKVIKWVGLPTSKKHMMESLEAEKTARMEKIKRKKEHLAELAAQQISYMNLVNRNRLTAPVPDDKKIYLPFIVVNTRKDTIIECEVAQNRSEYFFNFSQPFELHDDNEILKRMGMHVPPPTTTTATTSTTTTTTNTLTAAPPPQLSSNFAITQTS